MNQFNFEHTLKKILSEKNMTVKKFCEDFGTSQQNMNRIFRSNKISTDKLIEISDHLGVDVRSFFGDDVVKDIEISKLQYEIEQLKLDLNAYRRAAQFAPENAPEKVQASNFVNWFLGMGEMLKGFASRELQPEKVIEALQEEFLAKGLPESEVKKMTSQWSAQLPKSKEDKE